MNDTKPLPLPPPGHVNPLDVPVDGAELLDRVEALIRKYCILPSEEAYVATTLWVAHTYTWSAWETTPRLAILSAEKGSGKTRVLEVLQLLCFDANHTLNVSSSYLFRRYQQGQPTLLVDETDALFAGGKSGKMDPGREEIRGIINAGYRKGASVGRSEPRGQQIVAVDYPVFGAVALAGIKDLPDTVMNRSIVIWIKRRAPHEIIGNFRQRVVSKEAAAIKADLLAWGFQQTPVIDRMLDSEEFEMPEDITDRNHDKWEPMLAVADVAGGDWPKRGREAAMHFIDTHEESNTSTTGAQLLRDIREAFGDAEQVPTEWLLETLWANADTMWNSIQLTNRTLANKLKVYGVQPEKNPLWFYDDNGEKTQRRGYKRSAFEDAWVRYL